ncbi:MAG: histidine phosphatase family protein [Acidobacteria bacterium]|nr:histidine phosphatase family protein [Acidobacteriota bacterium]MBK9527941.1 histidine phosphatase family protein [Acidobacteriota bacterium]MBP7474226.1 histidine phosphatase family protein [Pyrinomonadaceae bacterium]MBP9109461.1 histidine phosphatase family protein [Pyrinomonadaceae bacterium]
MRNSILLLFALTVCLFAFGPVAAQSTNKTIVLVRHAEKDTSVANNPDSELSAEGRERAIKLMNFVKRYKPHEIFSTNYKRTRQTAEPIAAKRKKEIQTYDPAKQADLVAKIMASKTDHNLIVGHSNTIPVLANLIAKKEVFRNLLETEYGVVWVIRLKKGVLTKVEVFPF